MKSKKFNVRRLIQIGFFLFVLMVAVNHTTEAYGFQIPLVSSVSLHNPPLWHDSNIEIRFWVLSKWFRSVTSVYTLMMLSFKVKPSLDKEWYPWPV